MEKQCEHSARVDSILIQLMKKHAPEIAEKLEAENAANSRAAQANPSGGPAPAAAAVPATAGGVKRDAEGNDAAAKRQKVA